MIKNRESGNFGNAHIKEANKQLYTSHFPIKLLNDEIQIKQWYFFISCIILLAVLLKL